MSRFHTFFIALALLLMAVPHYSQTCQSLQDFEGGTVGPLPMAPQPFPGLFSAFGSPIIVEENCTPGGNLGLRLAANTPNLSDGDGVLYTTTGGINGEPFLAGTEYEFRFVKAVSAATSGINGQDFQNTTLFVALSNGQDCNMGPCEIVASKSIATLGMNCEPWDWITFTPSQDFDNLLFYVETESVSGLTLFVLIDDICIQRAPEACNASFEYVQEDCGKIQLTSTSEGAETWLYEFSGPSPTPNSTEENPCIEFGLPGTYQCQLSISCANGFSNSPIINIVVDSFDIDSPVIGNCPDSLVLLASEPECSVWYTPDLAIEEATLPYVYDVRIDGQLVLEEDSVLLSAGRYAFTATITDPCGNAADCNYDVIVQCTADTDCVDFDDQDQGGWYRYNSILRDPSNVSLGYNVSTRAVSIQASGPTGLPSDLYMNAADYSGSTWLVNEVDYDGNWKDYMDQCFCFDFNVLDDGDSSGTPRDAAPSFLLTSAFDSSQPIQFGTNPVYAISWQSTLTTKEREGWNKFCIAVDSCTSAGLPLQVKDGTWRYVSGPGTDCQSFNDVLCNVETVMFKLDLTGSPTEIFGFDNLCIEPCPPDPTACELVVTADTLSQADGSCCYELDMSINSSWHFIDFDLTTPGVVFNTAMIDTSVYLLDTLSNGTKLRVRGKSPGLGGNPGQTSQDFMKFCFAGVDSASQSPQCVIASLFGPGPVDNVVLYCKDTLKFNCLPPNDMVDSCLVMDLDAICDANDPNRYQLNFSATNLTASTASRINLTSLDNNVKFLPIGAPAGAIPQSTISVMIPGGLIAGATTSGLMATLVTTTAISAPTQWCLEAHLLTADMCCTSPTHYCTELDLCCDPCEEREYTVADISGIAVPQVITLSPTDDADYGLVQAGFLADATGPTMTSSGFNSLVISDGATDIAMLNFDLAAICQGGTVTKAELRLFADPSASPHYSDFTDNNCFKMRRITTPWTEATVAAGTLPTSTPTNEISMNAPAFPYEDYTVDVTALVNDMVANPSSGYGFSIHNTCGDQNMGLTFATRDNPNPSLHPQLVLTVNDENCPDPTLEGECCQALDITNACPTDFFTSVELKSITPGVNIGSHATGGTAPQDWYISSSTPNCITWNHTSGYLPEGTTADLIQFCLDDINVGETPQKVVLNWYALDGNGAAYVACSDTLTFECESIDNPCISVIEAEVKGSPCDSLDCYETPWCVQWLRDTITAQSTLSELHNYNTIETGYWNGQVVFIATNPAPPGAADIGNTDIYLCNGALIQKCELSIMGEICNPTAGIDPTTDIASKVLIWQTGDPIAPLDPDCVNGTGNQSAVDVCLTFKNTSQHFADQLIIYPITSGVSYWPNPISLLPTGSNACDTTAINFQLYGSAVSPGSTLKFAARLADTQNPDDWCCFESDTVCISIPNCPPTDPCCASQDTFDLLVNQGLEVTQNGCSVTVCANQFDTCHWFPNFSPDWGDGSIILPTVTQSDPPNNCWSYTYTTPGNYLITLPVWEGTIDEPCWDAVLSFEVACDSSSLPCDSLIVTNGPSTNVDSACCSTFTIDNNDTSSGNIYKGIIVRTTPPVSISQVQSLNGYTIHQLSPYSAEILHPTGSIPMVQQDVFTLCTTGYNSGPQNVIVHWLMQNGQDCIETCPTELDMQCTDDEDFKCFDFVQDSLHCESSTYCFQISNTSNPSFDIASVILYGVQGGSLAPTVATIPNGPLAAGATSDWICVNYSNAMPGDSICYSIAAENTDANSNNNICCTDTLVNCFKVPTCGTDACCASQDTFDLLVNQGLEVTQNGCSVTVCANQFDTCHWFPNLSPDWGDGSIILPTVTQSDPPNNCWSYTYTTPGNYLITLPVWEGTIDEPCWDAVLSFEVACDTNPTPVCGDCPNGQASGPNLLGNGDFELGNSMINSGLTYLASGVLGPGEYSVRSASSLGNPNWQVTDLTTGSGQVLVVDGLAGGTIWNNTINTTVGQDYNFCFFYDHLVAPRLSDGGNAVIDILIDNTVIQSVVVNQLPDGWVNVTLPFTASTSSTDIELRLSTTSTGFMDVAFDNLSVTSCGANVTDPCCDVTQDDFDDEFVNGTTYRLNGCELCLPFVLDSCEYLDIDFGDGTMISLQGGGLIPCYTYPGPSGAFTVTVQYYRLDANQDTCLSRSTEIDIVTSCPPATSSCLQVIDGELDCEQERYCFRIVNNSADTMRSVAFIEQTTGIALSPDPYQLASPLAPGLTSEQICLSYIGAFQGDSVCFNVVGHREDITIGEDPIVCCQDSTPVCFVIDCPVTPSDCITVVADSLDCSSQSYCIQVTNHTAFDINSIAFHNYSAGHSLSPDPLGIPTLTPGDTSDWICLNYTGAVAGDLVCYNIVGHEQDLSIGQEPIFCCSDTTQYCFSVDCDSASCCDVTDQYLEDLLTSGASVTVQQCEVTLPFTLDSCTILSLDFGDGDTWQSTGTDTIVHAYADNNTYTISITLEVLDDAGEVCAALSEDLEVTIDECSSGRICQIDDLEIFNAISPNDDGLNDHLVIEGAQDCQKNVLIYNRWGQLVYRDNNYQNDWQGVSFSGERLAEGTYFLIIQMTSSTGAIMESRQTYIDIRK